LQIHDLGNVIYLAHVKTSPEMQYKEEEVTAGMNNNIAPLDSFVFPVSLPHMRKA
jgi:hypothetical protein